MNNNEKLVAILSGGDWFDANVDHLIMPRMVNLEEEKKKYQKWYDDIYYPALASEDEVEYMGFDKWLINKCSARETTKNDIEIFDET